MSIKYSETENNNNREWSGKTGGTAWMQRSLISMMGIVDLRFFYGIMAAVVPFYMLLAHKGYLAAYRFLRQRMGYGRFKSFIGVYKNHYSFGQVILDRFATYAGKKFDTAIDGQEIFDQYELADQGLIMLGSHVGNYELIGYNLKSEKKSVNAVVFAGETETIMRNRTKILTANNMTLIPIKNDMSHLFGINEALEKGNIVSIHADRMMGNTKTFLCPFFSENAVFASGPFTLAYRRNVPVIAIFVMKEKYDKYHIYISDIKKLSETEGGKSSPEKMARVFASELERIVRKYPFQWFNYYDFWKK